MEILITTSKKPSLTFASFPRLGGKTLSECPVLSVPTLIYNCYTDGKQRHGRCKIRLKKMQNKKRTDIEY